MARLVEFDKFCINDYDVIGFDLDGCLLKYKWNTFFQVLHKYSFSYLTKVKHYDPNVIKPFDLGWKEVMFRGFLVDTKRGNLLWVLGDGTIQRAYHGRVQLNPDQIAAIYEQSKMPVLEKMLNNFINVDEYHMVDNYFESALVMIYCDLIQALDAKSLPADLSYQCVWNDIWSGYMNFFYSDSTELGTNFLDMSLVPDQFGDPCSTELKTWLKSLKAAHKHVFLMTSSMVKFAKGILNYILGPDYQDYFDFGIGRAGKPSFFYSDRKFVDVDKRDLCVTALESEHWYEFGSLDTFTDLLKNYTGISEPKVLYVGDGLKNDAFAASRFGRWGALIILEGMEVEGCGWHDPDNSQQIKQHKCAKVVADGDSQYVGNNTVWGSFFEDDGKETLFARVIRESSDIAIPWLDYITDLPVDHRFEKFDRNSGRLGYYPPLLHLRNS